MSYRTFLFGFFLIGLLGNAQTHAQSDDCADQLTEACQCPDGCDQDYCERVCDLEGEDDAGCEYVCRTCLCAPIPTRLRPLRLSAATSVKRVAKSTSAAADLREFDTPEGHFIIVKKGYKSRGRGHLGIRVKKAVEGLAIAEVNDGGPAQKAGLKAEDVIVAIGTEPARGLSLEQGLSLLRGEPGTRVRLTALRKSDGKKRKYDLMRSSQSFSSALEAPVKGVSIKHVPLSETKTTTCPPEWQGCHLLELSPTGSSCSYSCRIPR